MEYCMSDRHIHKISADGRKKNDDVRYVFQPVVSLRDGSIIGHEIQRCSSRQKKRGGLFALDAVFRYMTSADERILFFLLPYRMCADSRFLKGGAADKVVFEIHSSRIPHTGIGHLAVVIDDADSLYPLGFLAEFHPQYVKLDSSLVRKAENDTLAHTFVKSVTEFCHTAGIDVIAEGVETQKDVSSLIELGVLYAQGSFIQEPSERFDILRPEAYDFIVETNRRKNHINGLLTEVYIAHLCTASKTLEPDVQVETVYEMFKNDPDCFGFCVVRNARVLGIITRNRLSMHMSGRYGFMLHQKKPVSTIMDCDFLSADYSTPINKVSELAMQRSMDRLYDFIVVTRNAEYYGTVTVRDLLLKSTEIQIAHARSQNPLTGLPGNIIIEKMLTRCVSSGIPYGVLYIDINQFKAYNDVYGFAKGDEVIKQLARIMTDCLPADQFAGHVGGDDFVAVLTTENQEEYCRAVIQKFVGNLSLYYTGEDLKKGFITAENRRGVVEDFPLISLSIAGVYDAAGHFSDIHLLSEELARLKKIVKMAKGSNFSIEQFL
jgi:diguanylate cyclase (GGDEF)-like protein